MNTIAQITIRRQTIIKYAGKKRVTAAARRYNVGIALIYRWIERYDSTLESLKDRSHCPHSHPNENVVFWTEYFYGWFVSWRRMKSSASEISMPNAIAISLSISFFAISNFLLSVLKSDFPESARLSPLL